ncbi:MAG: Transcriptional regulator, PaaX family protein [Parcubacteria group bacterium GW2011_GWA2_49_9]|nr:MAG: Transcriptional regulator, PaaX family protein [Parcubacteria group bacterium GW2011_GWA2_49_9]
MKKKSIEVTKLILQSIFVAGVIIIAASSPSFVGQVLPRILNSSSKDWYYNKNRKKYSTSFYGLRSKGFDICKYRNKQLHITLSRKGRKLAEKYSINDLKIKQPEKWDGYWRVLIFDVKEKQKLKREALRGKFKDLGFYQLQKSVWVYPYECQREVNVLRGFFILSEDELNIITATKIENDYRVRHYFKLK